MKRFIPILLVVFLLCGCQTASQEMTTPQTAFTGDFDAYKSRYSGRWERSWEEDILFFAEKYLTEHSRVSERNFFTEYALDLSGESEVVFDQSAFDLELRLEFIGAVDALLASIPDQTDLSIANELSRIAAMLNDVHSSVYREYTEVLPICYEAFYGEAGVDYRVSCISADQKELMMAKLLRYNGIPVEQIVERVSAYISHESDGALGFMMTPYLQYAGLNEKGLLCAAGIVDEKDRSVLAEFETAEGIETLRIAFHEPGDLPSAAFHPMLTGENLRYSREEPYWWTMLDERNLYVRLSTMVDDFSMGYSIDNLFSEVRTAMRDSALPLKVILDLRGNGGGYVHESALKGFVSATEWYEHDGIYILIDGNCFSAGALVPYYLREAIDGAMLVGAPTGQGLWFPANSAWYELPNSGIRFSVGDEIICAQLGWEGDALLPDVTLYQTYADFEAGVDTVLNWALSN